jgi:hypothetical protein
MNSKASALFIIRAAVLCVVFLAGCAATIPSVSSGSSESFFMTPGDVPKRVMVGPGGSFFDIRAGKVLRSELPSLGFQFVESNPDAIFVGEVKTSDYQPVHMNIQLENATTGRVLWRAKVSRNYDLYTSVVSATESNARKAIELLRSDLQKARSRE